MKIQTEITVQGWKCPDCEEIYAILRKVKWPKYWKDWEDHKYVKPPLCPECGSTMQPEEEN